MIAAAQDTAEHTQALHEAIKRDDSAWSLLDPKGVQRFPGYDGEPEERYELRNCSCHSTLARRIQ